MSIKFSIITVCYNEEKRIQRTIDSIFSQSYNNYELLIKDGASIDETLCIVESYLAQNSKRLKIYSHSDNGIYYAMNEAIDFTDGDYICFINAGDELFNSDTLAEVANFIENNKGYDVFYADSLNVYRDGAECRVSVAPMEQNLRKVDMDCGWPGMIHQTMYTKRDVLCSCKFDVSYKLRAELNWYYECLNRGYRFKKMPLIACRYEMGGVSENPKNSVINTNETMKILKKHGYEIDNYIIKQLRARERLGTIKFVYSMWIELLQRGFGIGKFLKSKGIERVAIYGCGEMGILLHRELKNSGIEVPFFIDKKVPRNLNEISVIRPEDFVVSNKVDLIIVSAIMSQGEIINSDKFDGAHVISMYDLIEDIMDSLR